MRYYFEKFGTVLDTCVMMDKYTGKPRGFGFVTFEDSTGMCTGRPLYKAFTTVAVIELDPVLVYTL